MTYKLGNVRPIVWCQCTAALLLAGSLGLGNGALGAVVRRALEGDGNRLENKWELADFVDACDNLLGPLFTIALVITPLVMIGGAALVGIGKPRGWQIIASAAFALILVGTSREFAA